MDQGSELSLNVGQVHLINYNDAKDKFQRNTNWWTVFASFDLPDFVPSILWISKKTEINVEEVAEALEGLLLLGYLKKNVGFFEPIKDKEFSSFDWKTKTKSEIINEHAVVSQQILNQMREDVTLVFDHRFFAANKSVMVELYKDIQVAMNKAFKASQENKSENDSIFKLTFTGVDVLNKCSQKNRGQ